MATLLATSVLLTACDGSGAKASGKSSSPPIQGDGVLKIGTLLPDSGDTAFLGPPMHAGVDLAIKEVNAAGGVLGKPVESSSADSGDGTPKIAPGGVDKLLTAKSDVIIGAASSSVSLSVIDKITGAGVVQFSPSSTGTVFDTYDDKGLFFRTAPSDALQGNVLGNLILQDGAKNIAIVARQDTFGEALAHNVEKTIKDQGGTVAVKLLYSVDATSYTSEIQKIKDSKPDAIALIAFNETTKIIPGLEAAGIGPKNINTYFVDGNTADYSSDFPKGTLNGVKSTMAGTELSGDFKARLLEVNPKLKEFAFAAESHDAVILSALAATAAKSDDARVWSKKLKSISTGGIVCAEYRACVTLLEDGKDIDYNGVSGPIDLNDNGSPSKATMGIYQYGEDNTYKNIDYITGVIE